MKQYIKEAKAEDENLWESEEAFRKRLGAYADLGRFRDENPGLWRIDANGKYIYDATGWRRREGK